MAQHHAQLKPWEVANKNLPDGAIVAYYRSPFPNVGAAAIGINNTQVLKTEDPEAFSKSGVAYMNPWTAKNIAITDFDRDANGYFVGYLAEDQDLPQQIREALAHTIDLPASDQYEAGRVKFAELITQMQTNPEQSPLKAGDYPLAVAEFIERNAPDRKPPEVTKQKKVKHPWKEGESHSAATWRAWQVTANNPTGMVANVGMTLQSFAWETQYIGNDRKEDLLNEISTHFSKQIKQVEDGKLHVPDDRELGEKGFPAYGLLPRMTEIAAAKQELAQISGPDQRRQFIDAKLEQTHRLLLDVVDGPNAVNLQTAVDTAKSSRGIDEDIQALAQALAYKPHLMRQHQKSPTIYLRGKELPTNTQEPIGWGVEQANQIYQETRLPELDNRSFRDLLPKTSTPEQEAHALSVVRYYNGKIKAAREAKDRLSEKRPEDQQPTLTVTSPSSGNQILIQRLTDVDPKSESPIWKDEGSQSDWKIVVERNPEPDEKNAPELFVARLLYVDDNGQQQTQPLGYVAPESAAEHQLEQKLTGSKFLSIASPIIELQPSFAEQNNIEFEARVASAWLKDEVAQIPAEERMAYASALWHHSEGAGIVLREFTPELIQNLQSVPEVTLRGVQRSSNEAGLLAEGEYTVRFTELSYVSDMKGNNQGQTKTVPAIAVVSDEGEKMFAAISDESVHLPPGSLAKAQISISPSGKTAKLQVLERLQEVQEGDRPIQQAKPVAEPEQYPISSGEARNWYMAAQVKGDRQLTQYVRELGLRLKQHYNSEMKEDGTLNPPSDYQNPDVVITKVEQQGMEKDIAILESARLQFQQSGKKQVEYG
jgi:hypothetical protein